MALCPGCGEENPDRFRLCGFCGTPLAAELPKHEVRKTVTIVFSDLKGSTSLGERLDPESLREVMTHYFAEMRAALERHGGRVEKYIGDAIMAVFGLPKAHEDDALRAVRAACEMKAALEAVNEELEKRWGVRLENRTGVNTGEVVAGDSVDAQRLVTGDTVNVAARLEQAAPALEILIGEPTYRLVRHAVEVEEVEPLELKGKAERVGAYRLRSVREDVETVLRNRQAKLVGRERELELLEMELAGARSESRPRLVTVVAQAGLGKSRLVEELLTRAGAEATTLRGRALAYGDGITFWPLVEVVRQAAGIQNNDRSEVALEKLRALAPEHEDVVARVGSAIGLAPQSFPLHELFWATRELFELLAQERPLVVAFEDLHWAEPTFLALVESLAEGVEAPLLLLCDARPELLETRRGWAQRERASVVELEPLSDAESERVIENMLGDTGLEGEVLAHVVRAAEGNPLFVEQLMSMLLDDGLIELVDDRWRTRGDLGTLTIPPTIQTLLAARLDRLTDEQRAVLDPAAVIGHIFPADAVRALVPDPVRPDVEEHLAVLVFKQLVAAVGPESGFDDGYRFEHVLIRDTAYDALLKRNRATLHERFVDWAEEFNRSRGRESEFEEILGYHLEQAHRYLGELGPLDDHGRGLGVRGSEKLASAGRRAFQRGDMPAAVNLLRRASALLPADDPSRRELLPILAEAMMETGGFAAAEALLEEVVATADDVRLRSEAVLTRLLVQHHVSTDLAAWRNTVLAEAESLIPALGAIGAHAELAKAWRMIGFVYGPVSQWGKQVDAVQRALEHARLAADARLESRLASSYVCGLCEGPTAVPEAIALTREILERGLPDRQAQAMIRCLLAIMLAMNGEFDAAREEYHRGGALVDALGGGVMGGFVAIASARAELLASSPEQAEKRLRDGYDALGLIGERYFRPLVGAWLAHTLLELGATDRASEVVGEIEAQADPDDIEAQALLRSVRARLCASADAIDLALELAREAIGLTGTTDAPVMHANALVTLAGVLVSAGQEADADAALGEARQLYEQKGNLAAAAWLRAAATGVNSGQL
jgi:class 3 adenylate cyclase/tetratricopeptide (TPR) repeat protein